MKNKMKIMVIAISICFLFFAGCKTKETPVVDSSNKISAEEAYKIMTERQDVVILDVRTEAEFREKRIEGAVLIPDYEILDRIETEFPDKNQLILVYCRSGRRSANAVKEMVGLGYTAVYDFGGINDWPYKTISD
jgi:rhodanese-related sulfurtransferase